MRHLLVTLLLLASHAVPALAETRIALVVGVSTYNSPDLQALPSAVADARAMAAKLQNLGFDTELLLDPTRVALRRGLSALFKRRQADDAAVALIYFAGHGLQSGGKGFLLARDSALVPKGEMELHQEVSLTDLLRPLAEAKVAILMLDACRNSPGFADRLARKTGETLTAGLPDPGQIRTEGVVSYSAEPGATALDAIDDHPNSPYAEALLDYLGRPNVELAAMLQGVRRYVQRATQGAQSPMFEDRRQPGAAFYFYPAGLRVTHAPAAPPANGAAPDQPGRISAHEALALLTGKTGAARSSALAELIARPGLLAPIEPGDVLALLGDIPDDAGRRHRALTALLPLLDLPIDPGIAQHLLAGLSEISRRGALSDMLGCLSRPVPEQQAQGLVEGTPPNDIPRLFRQLTSASTAPARCGGGP